MKRSIALGFVIFNPSGNFTSRAQMAIDSGFDVYIFDNSPEMPSINGLTESSGKIRYFTCGKNRGLGLGIRTVCTKAYEDEHEALIFFDQDSVFTKQTLLFIDNFYATHTKLKRSHSAVVFNANRICIEQNDCLTDVLITINSGSLFYLNNLKSLGWHNERYFVDGVDYEFCLRSRQQGFKVAEYTCTPGFDHATEQPDEKYRVFGKAFSMRPYALSRIQDVSISSFKLIFSALVFGDIKFAFRITKHFIVFIGMQTLVRIKSPVKTENRL
jgi:rhamnosyltransferase